MPLAAAPDVPAFEDALAESLRSLGVGHAMSVYSELAGRWGMILPAAGATAAFHMVFAGACYLRLDGLAPLRLDAAIAATAATRP